MEVSAATPIAPPSWRIALNLVAARPVAAGVMVANDAGREAAAERIEVLERHLERCQQARIELLGGS
jgi:hypothetical protein